MKFFHSTFILHVSMLLRKSNERDSRLIQAKKRVKAVKYAEDAIKLHEKGKIDKAISVIIYKYFAPIKIMILDEFYVQPIFFENFFPLL